MRAQEGPCASADGREGDELADDELKTGGGDLESANEKAAAHAPSRRGTQF